MTAPRQPDAERAWYEWWATQEHINRRPEARDGFEAGYAAGAAGERGRFEEALHRLMGALKVMGLSGCDAYLAAAALLEGGSLEVEVGSQW